MFNFHDRKGTYYQIELWTLIRFVCIHSLETPKALINIQSIFYVFFFVFSILTPTLCCNVSSIIDTYIHNDTMVDGRRKGLWYRMIEGLNWWRMKHLYSVVERKLSKTHFYSFPFRTSYRLLACFLACSCIALRQYYWLLIDYDA